MANTKALETFCTVPYRTISLKNRLLMLYLIVFLFFTVSAFIQCIGNWEGFIFLLFYSTSTLFLSFLVFQIIANSFIAYSLMSSFIQYTVLGYPTTFDKSKYSYELILYSSVLNFLGLAIFLFSYTIYKGFLGSKRLKGKENVSYNSKSVEVRFFWLFIFFFIIFLIRVTEYGGILNWIIAPYWYRGEIKIGLPYWYLSKLALVIPLAIFGIYYKGSVFSRLLAFFPILIAVIDGNRGTLVSLAFLVFLYTFSFSYNFKGAVKSIVALLGIFILVVIITNVRGTEGNVATLHESEIFSENLLSTLTVDTMDNYLFILSTYGKARDYINGYSFLALITNYVPREIWKKKPVGFGKILSIEKDNNYNNSLGPFINGEMYANFGTIGVLLFWSVFALITLFVERKANRLLRYEGFFKIFGIFVSVLPSTFIRGDLLASFNNFLWPLITIGIIGL